MKQLIARDRSALVLWSIALVVVGVMVIVTRTVIRDLDPVTWEWAALAFAWVVCGLFVASALSEPCTRAELAPDRSVTFTFRYPHRRVRKTFPADRLAAPTVETHRDSDGDIHHTARLSLPDGTDFVLSQGGVRTGSESSQARNRQRCEEACARFSAALSHPTPPPFHLG